MGHPPQRHVWGLWDAAISIMIHVWQCRAANRTCCLILPLLGSHLIPNTSGRRTTSLVVCFWKTTASSGDSQSTGTLVLGKAGLSFHTILLLVSEVPARDASASPPALGVFSPNGDVRVNEDMTNAQTVHTQRDIAYSSHA
jgi:hypothetical protein